MRFSQRSAVAFLAALFTAGAIMAAIPVAVNNTNPVVFDDGAAHFLPLKTSGETAVAFNASGRGQKTLISFSAECQVVGAVNTWADIDILVDGVAVAPSNSDNALCAGGGVGVTGRWSSNVVNAVVTGLSQGPHSLQVRVLIQLFDPGDFVRIDDSATVLVR